MLRWRIVRMCHLLQDCIQLFLHFANFFRFIYLLILIDLAEEVGHSLNLRHLRPTIFLFEFWAKFVDLGALVHVLLLNLLGQHVYEFFALFWSFFYIVFNFLFCPDNLLQKFLRKYKTFCAFFNLCQVVVSLLAVAVALIIKYGPIRVDDHDARVQIYLVHSYFAANYNSILRW